MLSIESKFFFISLKPENIVIGKDGYIKLTDFGLAEVNITKDRKITEFCGTPEYLAPEFFDDRGYNKEIDWWSLGVLIYEMISGVAPFNSKNKEQLFEQIKKARVEYPSDISDEARDLMSKLFVVNPSQRLGANGAEEIMKHSFYNDIDWDMLIEKRIKPPFMPRLQTSLDTRYIHNEFLQENNVESVTSYVLTQDDKFMNDNFSYQK